jgi:hypothetical protein
MITTITAKAKKVQRSLLIAVMMGLLSTPAFAIDVLVSGAGTGSASDQATADAQAQQQATDQVNALCAGVTRNVEFTSDNCASLGSDDNPSFLCVVTAKAVCHFPDMRPR